MAWGLALDLIGAGVQMIIANEVARRYALTNVGA
jgi:hypothetical protein